MPTPWESLAALAPTLIALFFLNDWIGRHIQGVGLLLTGHSEGSMVLTWLLLLPGVALHEASHWIVARVLGLRPSRLRIWPERRGKMMRMGFVDFRAGGALRDSLVGAAPFVSGCAVLLWIATRVFGLDGQMGWSGALAAIRLNSGHADIWLYTYLIFAISNGMMPSASDRQPWGSLLLYVGAVGVSLYALELLPAVPPDLAATAVRFTQMLTYALALAVAVDVVVALAIGGMELALSALRRQRVRY